MATNNRNGSSSADVATTGDFRSNIGEAGSSLKQAAVDTSEALRRGADPRASAGVLRGRLRGGLADREAGARRRRPLSRS